VTIAIGNSPAWRDVDGRDGIVLPRELYQRYSSASNDCGTHRATYTLALHHRDPFDRLLVSTAIVEALTLISAAETFDDYGLTRLW
jgi:hypothetical protein